MLSFRNNWVQKLSEFDAFQVLKISIYVIIAIRNEGLNNNDIFHVIIAIRDEGLNNNDMFYVIIAFRDEEMKV